MERTERLILASGSPRRRELLRGLGLEFEVMVSPDAEAPHPGLGPEELVRALAEEKALRVQALAADPDAVIVAADTVVEIDGTVLGKPGTPERAKEMLSSLSGRTHRVWTGVCVRRGERMLCRAECTQVCFRELSSREIGAYVDTGEPMDKAGAYGIQGRAALFVREIRGDYFNVMGLPLCVLGLMLREFGVEPLVP